MKTLKYSQDGLAKFIFRQALKIKKYNFDAFYDISKIVTLLQENRSNSEIKKKQTLYLMLRSTGCDLIDPFSPYYLNYEKNSNEIFELVFCWNCDYFSNEYFCTIKRIK
jgi:hypothetical protein